MPNPPPRGTVAPQELLGPSRKLSGSLAKCVRSHFPGVRGTQPPFAARGSPLPSAMQPTSLFFWFQPVDSILGPAEGVEFLVSGRGVSLARHTPVFEVGVLRVLNTSAWPSFYPSAGDQVTVHFVVESPTPRVSCRRWSPATACFKSKAFPVQIFKLNFLFLILITNSLVNVHVNSKVSSHSSKKY